MCILERNDRIFDKENSYLRTEEKITSIVLENIELEKNKDIELLQTRTIKKGRRKKRLGKSGEKNWCSLQN